MGRAQEHWNSKIFCPKCRQEMIKVWDQQYGFGILCELCRILIWDSDTLEPYLEATLFIDPQQEIRAPSR